MEDLNPHLIHGSLGPDGISIGPAVYAGLTIMTDRPTDRPHYTVCITGRTYYVVLQCAIGRIYVHSIALWSENKGKVQTDWQTVYFISWSP